MAESIKRSTPSKGALGVPPGWVRRVIDRAVQQAKLILRASNFYADNIYNKDGNGIPNFPNDLKRPGVYGAIFVNDGSTNQVIGTGTTPVKSTGFTDNGLSKDCTPDAANDKITITRLGVYWVGCSTSFRSASSGTVWHITPFLNGVAQVQLEAHRKVANANDVGDTASSGFIDVTTVPWDLDMRVHHDSGGDANFTPEDMSLNLTYVGET